MQEIPCSGIFVAIGNEPNVSLFENSVALDGRYVDADETTRTNLPGVFAVGDVRKKPLRQVVTAVADGAWPRTLWRNTSPSTTRIADRQRTTTVFGLILS